MRWYKVITSVFLSTLIGTTDAQAEVDIEALQTSVVSKLSGQSEVLPRLWITDRYLLRNRQNTLDYLVSVLKDLDYEPKRHDYATGTNLYAVLDSTDQSSSWVIVGAHYDSVEDAPGANDNATGVAAVVALAAELKNITPRRLNVIFAFFDEEEEHFKGSRAFAKMLKAKNYAVDSAHTFDQLGWDQNNNRAIELERPSKRLLALYQEVHASLKSSFPLHVSREKKSDHSSFRREHYEAIGLTEEYRHDDTTPYRDTLEDTFSTVNFAYLRHVTDFLTAVMRKHLSSEPGGATEKSEGRSESRKGPSFGYLSAAKYPYPGDGISR